MGPCLSAESLRGKRAWIVVVDAADGLRILGRYEVAPRRAEYLAKCVERDGLGDYVVSVEYESAD